MDNNNERDIIQRAIDGDESAFETLVLSCEKKAYNISFRYLRNDEDAQDAVQESFIKLYRHLKTFNFSSRFDTWFYRIVVNVCKDILRKRKTQQELYDTTEKAQDDEFNLDFKDSALNPEEHVISEERQNIIMYCIDKLADEHREVIILRDINGFTYEQITGILSCSMGTVKSRISRARLKLREIYIKESQKDKDGTN
ncbi:MAG: RNA polymerase sigma factor [Eubacteriales bacterium]|nr:RNA polymerase sigma factor [Eubacteriales bacterium]MDD4389490.1 RNA polymerase sigma factor [Eubacteriales bacterium]